MTTLQYKEVIKLLIELQKKDIAVDALKARAVAIPVEIAALNQQISDSKGAIENAKKTTTQCQVEKKQKELDAEAKDGLIKKHNIELGAVKTNEAYKALLSEIESAKKDKYAIEDEILVLMEKIETAQQEMKKLDAEYKAHEGMFRQDIGLKEQELIKLNAEIAVLTEDRNKFAATLPDDIVKRYDYIREARNGVAVVAVEGNVCGGCHITLRPQMINEVFKDQEIIACDSCSRILYKK